MNPGAEALPRTKTPRVDKREDNKAHVVWRVKAVRDLLDGVLEDLADGQTDLGTTIRACGMELSTIDIRLGGARVPKLQIGKRGAKEGRA